MRNVIGRLKTDSRRVCRTAVIDALMVVGVGDLVEALDRREGLPMADRHQMLLLGTVTPLRMRGVIVLVEIAAGGVFGVDGGMVTIMSVRGIGASDDGNYQSGNRSKINSLAVHTDGSPGYRRFLVAVHYGAVPVMGCDQHRLQFMMPCLAHMFAGRRARRCSASRRISARSCSGVLSARAPSFASALISSKISAISPSLTSPARPTASPPAEY